VRESRRGKYCGLPPVARKSAPGEIYRMHRRMHRRIRLRSIALLAATFGTVAGCRHKSGHDSLPSMPGYAPESTPSAIRRELVRPENVLVDPPGISGRIVKNALYIRFTDAAGERERTAALRAIGGVVIGGLRMKDGELYHVRIEVPRDSGAGPLLRARATLRALPQVQQVLLDMLDPLP